MDAGTLYSVSVEERKDFILKEARKIDTSHVPDTQLQEAYARSQVINSFIKEYISIRVEADQKQESSSILNEENFVPRLQASFDVFLARIAADIEILLTRKNKQTNLYEMAGAVGLASANNISRRVSTLLGGFWEELANISPYGINPESEFGLKIKGVDLIANNKNTGELEYMQLKTTKNTLTGSQKERSVNELSLHDSPYFVACFDANTNWTFNSHKIPRICGKEFWERIGIDYTVLKRQVLAFVKEIDKLYVDFVEKKAN